MVRKDGRKASINDVLYVYSMTISMGQSLAKGYNIKLEKNQRRCMMEKEI